MSRRWIALLSLAISTGCASAPDVGSCPHRTVKTAHRQAALDAAIQAYVRQRLEPRLTCDLHVWAYPPFLVIGDEPPHRLRNDARYLVGASAELLKRDFFERDPSVVTEIWLLRDAESYARHIERLTGQPPMTPYGFYDPRQRAIFVNLALGGGTLIHELVHAYMHENFPAAPPWFNEGLGSLFEGSRIVDGHLLGTVNWRLPQLRVAMLNDVELPLDALMSTTFEEFYDTEPGINYAQARYLLLYLQQRRLLVSYHRAFLARHAADPTGYRTFLDVVAERPDLIERDFRRWVLAL